MNRLRRLLQEIHQRSLWQVLGIYVGGSWAVLEVVDHLQDRFGLPDWSYGLALVLLLVGLPLVLATAFVQPGRGAAGFPAAGSGIPAAGPASPASPASRLRGVPTWLTGPFTWRRAVGGGMLALCAWTLLAAGWILWKRAPDEGVESTLDPGVVAVFPFRTSGAGQDIQYLGEGIVDLLSLKLTGEGGLRAVDPRAALVAWRRSLEADGEATQHAVLEAARSLGAGRVIDGGIVGTPGRLIFSATVLEVPTGRTRAVASVEGPEDELIALVDRLTAQLLAGSVEGTARLRSLPTTSLPVLQAYLEGQREYRGGAYGPAILHFTEALDEDSLFAPAALALWEALGWGAGVGSKLSRADALRLAFAARDRLSPRDLAWFHALAGPRYPEPASDAELLTAAERFVNQAPDRAEAWYRLGDLHFHEGWLVGEPRPLERARVAFERAVGLDSLFAAPINHLALVAAMQGDVPAARGALERYEAVDSTAYPALLRWRVAHAAADSTTLAELRADWDGSLSLSAALGIVDLAQEHGIGMEDADAALDYVGRNTTTRVQEAAALAKVVELEWNRGRPSAAAAAHRRLAELQPTPSDRALLILAALFWDADESIASETLRSIDRASSPRPPVGDDDARAAWFFDACATGQWWAWHGSAELAEAAADRLGEADPVLDLPRARRTLGLCEQMIRTVVSVVDRRQDAGDRLEALDRALSDGPPVSRLLQNVGALTAARLWEMRQRPDRALAALRRRHHWVNPSFMAPTQREAGRLAEVVGDRQGAIRAYRHYLALRAAPEPALVPQRDSVRVALDRLEGRTR